MVREVYALGILTVTNPVICIVDLSVWIAKALPARKHICTGEDIAQYPPNYLQSKPPSPWGTIDHWKGGRLLSSKFIDAQEIFLSSSFKLKCGCTYFCADQYHLT